MRMLRAFFAACVVVVAVAVVVVGVVVAVVVAVMDIFCHCYIMFLKFCIILSCRAKLLLR